MIDLNIITFKRTSTFILRPVLGEEVPLLVDIRQRLRALGGKFVRGMNWVRDRGSAGGFGGGGGGGRGRWRRKREWRRGRWRKLVGAGSRRRRRGWRPGWIHWVKRPWWWRGGRQRGIRERQVNEGRWRLCLDVYNYIIIKKIIIFLLKMERITNLFDW